MRERERTVVLAFRVSASVARAVRQAAARDERLPGPFLRRLVQRVLADSKADSA